MQTNQFDELVPDAQVRKELGGVTAMTIWRWDNGRSVAPPGWEPPVYIGPRKHRTRRMVETVKTNAISRSIEAGAGKAA